MTRTIHAIALIGIWTLPLAAQTMETLFDETVLHEIRLEIHPSDWRSLQENYLVNTYYPANFQWRGVLKEEIGVRSRGNGSRSSAKPGLKLDFNQFASNGEFLGLKSLVLDNLTQDQTMMKERLSMQMFRRMGIPAPRVVHTKLFVNNVYAGLYTIVEPVDKGFLKRNLGEDGGYLYDYEWVSHYQFEDLGDDASNYTPYPFELQTNESNPNPAPLVNMIRTINNAPDAEFLNALSKHLDPAAFLKYLAVEAYLAESDGIVGDWGMNNFYLYGHANSERFTFIPWDKDVTFAGVNRSVWQNTDQNVLTRRLLAIPEMRAYFLDQVRRCDESARGWLEQQVDAQYQQVLAAVIDDPVKPFTYSQFEAGVSLLRDFAFYRGYAVVDVEPGIE